MAGETLEFRKGDWIVHKHYGVGQIKSIEKKRIGDESASYYRVKTRNSTFWVPVKGVDSPRIRPIASKYKMRRALTTLRRKPKEMDSNYKKRQIHIQEALADGSLTVIAELVRDLAWRQNSTKLNPGEEDVLNKLVNRLVKEWSICMKVDMSEAKQKLNDILHKQPQEVGGD